MLSSMAQCFRSVACQHADPFVFSQEYGAVCISAPMYLVHCALEVKVTVDVTDNVGWQVLAAAGKHQVLIFVHSRKETAKTAKFLKEEALKEDKLARFMGVRFTPNYDSSHSTLNLWIPFCMQQGSQYQI